MGSEGPHACDGSRRPRVAERRRRGLRRLTQSPVTSMWRGAIVSTWQTPTFD